MEERTVTKHDSFGLFSVHRITGGNGVLFGSSVRHHNRVRLTISRARWVRDSSHDWYMADDELIEVDLSPVQWAEAITSMNVGPGSPCTIVHINHETMPDCPAMSERELIQDEFKEKMKKVVQTFDKEVNVIKEALTKKTVLMSDRKTILDALRVLQMQLASNVPFMHTQFNEAMEHTVAEAKGEIEAFYTNAVLRVGQEALSASMRPPQMLEDKS